jgi:hypothetical protein
MPNHVYLVVHAWIVKILFILNLMISTIWRTYRIESRSRENSMKNQKMDTSKSHTIQAVKKNFQARFVKKAVLKTKTRNQALFRRPHLKLWLHLQAIQVSWWVLWISQMDLVKETNKEDLMPQHQKGRKHFKGNRRKNVEI